MRGLSSILEDTVVGAKAKELFADAQAHLRSMIDGKLTARAVYGFFLKLRGDDILIYKDDARSEVLKTLPTLRQQILKPSGQHHHALADYVAPEDSGLKDYVGFFAVTTGHGCDEWAATFEADHDDYGSIMTKALADRLAEAFAECLHQTARKEWQYGGDESLNNEDRSRRYRGLAHQGILPVQTILRNR